MTSSHSTSSENLNRDVRKYIFDYFEEHSSAPVLEQIMRRFKMDRPDAFKTLENLVSAHHIALVPDTQRILMAWPFSAVSTPFTIRTADNREYFANCAWDAVAFHVMLRKDQWIDSFCHHCGDDINIHLKDQRTISAQPSNPLVYLALPAAKWWENILVTCSNNMVFFSSHGHLKDWAKSISTVGEALSIEQTLKLSVPFYRRRMDVDYVRPSRDETIALFQSLELRGDFWQI